MRRLILVSTVIVAAVATIAAAPRQTKGPIVLLVHGRGFLGRDTAQLRREWVRAMRSGADALGDSAALGNVDVRLVWYADALDPREPIGCTARGTTGHDAGDDLREMLGVFGGVLAAAASIDSGTSAPLRAVAGDLLYFGDRRRRCAAAERIDAAVRSAARERRPVVMVAHSFGSFVAYDYLRSRARSDSGVVARFVTVGSLLGSREVRAILFGTSDGVTIPAGVGEWVNVFDARDLFASRFGVAGANGPVDLTSTGLSAYDPHDLGSYLRDPVTVGAILGRK
jgi:hypothetical protein